MVLEYRKDGVVLLSNDTEDIIKYTITKLFVDGKKVLYKSATLEGGEIHVYHLEDYLFNFLVVASDNEVLYDKDIQIYHNTLNYIKEGLNDICFDCGCKTKPNYDCDKCSDINIKTVNLLIACIHYYNIGFTKFKPVYDFLSEKSLGESTEFVNQFVKNIRFVGTGSLEKFYNKLILIYYSTFMFAEIVTSANFNESKEAKEKYDYDKYIECILANNIKIEDLMNSLDKSSRVYYWQEKNLQVRIDAISPLIDDVYLSGMRNEAYSVFEQGYKIKLEQVGKIVIAIKYSHLHEYEIYDVLGNDITDAFDAMYIEEESTQLFLSKNHFTLSEVYFKIKKN